MAQIFSGAARHARPDGLLVPLRDHVRGAVHPDDHRHRHARRRASWCRSSSGSSTRRWRGTDWLPGLDRLDAARRLRAGATSSGPAASARSGRCSASPTSCSPSVALAVGTTIIINMGKAPLRLGHAGAAGVRLGDDADGGLPERPRQLLADGDRAGPRARTFRATSNTALTIIMMVCVVVILANAAWRCTQVLRGRLAIMPEPATTNR